MLKKSQVSKATEQTLTTAMQYASDFREGYVSTQHILLALIDQEYMVVDAALESLGIDDMYIETELACSMGNDDPQSPKDLQLTPSGKRLIELAGREMGFLGDTLMEPEHLLLGLFHEGVGLAGHLIDGCGVTLQQARIAVLEARKKEKTA